MRGAPISFGFIPSGNIAINQFSNILHCKFPFGGYAALRLVDFATLTAPFRADQSKSITLQVMEQLLT
jgi:hypothetical protein